MPFTHIRQGELVLSFCGSCGIFVAASRMRGLLQTVEGLHNCETMRQHKDFPRLVSESEQFLKRYKKQIGESVA